MILMRLISFTYLSMIYVFTGTTWTGMMPALVTENIMRAVLAMVALVVSLAGCADRPVPPLASAPFSVARKGNVLSIPFTVPPDADLSYTYMLAFKFQRPERGDPIDLFWGWPPKATLRLKVKLVHVRGEIETAVPVNDYAETYNPISRTVSDPGTMQERRTDVANVSMVRHQGRIAEMEVVRFRLPEVGRYRLDIETLSAMEIFEPIMSWVTVDREYRHVK